MKFEDLRLPWHRQKVWYWRKYAFQLSFDPGDWVFGPTFGPVTQQGFPYIYVSFSLGPVTFAVMW